MAERFARGGRLIAFGALAGGALGRAPRRGRVRPPGDRRQARAAGDRRSRARAASSPPARAARARGGHRDRVRRRRGRRRGGARGRARARARLPDDRVRAARAPSGSSSRRATTASIRQELVETLYHVLWELVHVFFEHRGLLAGREPRRVHDAGASSFLYPFLGRARARARAGRRRRAPLGADEGRGDRRRCATQTLDRQSRRAARGGGRAAATASSAAASCSRSATAARRPTRWTSSPTSARRRGAARRGRRST